MTQLPAQPSSAAPRRLAHQLQPAPTLAARRPRSPAHPHLSFRAHPEPHLSASRLAWPAMAASLSPLTFSRGLCLRASKHGADIVPSIVTIVAMLCAIPQQPLARLLARSPKLPGQPHNVLRGSSPDRGIPPTSTENPRTSPICARHRPSSLLASSSLALFSSRRAIAPR